jgi:formate dehydrogenase beta subunit/formate dehydrogenase gamma subunit
MLIDTSTCIGCKACEVACVEWNDLRIEPETHRRTLRSYQTLPDLTPSYWNLIRFNEVEVDGRLMMLMRKDMCLHCAEPGCLAACPAEGAILKLRHGIIDFQQEHCIGCGYCMTGCPFNIPRLDPRTERVYKCTMCVDRVDAGLGPACVKACPTGCLEFGEKTEMRAHAEQRAAQLREDGFAQAGVYDPPGVGGTGVIYVLQHADRPELYELPKEPRIDPKVRLWRGAWKAVGDLSLLGSVLVAGLHFLRFGPQRVPTQGQGKDEAEREILRYTVAERALHWTLAASFLYLMLTGLGLFLPGLAFLLVLCGGGAAARALHPLAGLLFAGAALVQMVHWLRDLRLRPEDGTWLRQVRAHVRGHEGDLPPSGRFNAGQKLLFRAQVVLALILLGSGVPLWFPAAFSQPVRAWAALFHSVSGVVAMLSLVVHVYMAVFVTRGALRAMTEGKVSAAWARRHHAAWAKQELGE